MHHTLWQGDTLLGEVVFELPSPAGSLAGLFRPTPDFSHIEHLMQTRIVHAPGQPVIRLRPVPAKKGGTPLTRLSVEEGQGLPKSEQWILKDRSGQEVATVLVSLMDEDVYPGAGPMPDACRAHGFRERVWILAAQC